ncbi:putative thiamine transporter SLC35F3 isoform X6 [Nasonia vitripennis]|uniref:Thiamine transporter SLC35F3 n=1 Tax=Nasonia vitripennis TaxID=7425 RepID=A0A7M7Q9J6_NASVI|nr:putative thiamine transporter SLC35F3 isoform X6 [Nasonia vitripennis]
MKNSNPIEVPTIFQPRKCRSHVFSPSEEQSISEQLTNSQKIDITDDIHHSGTIDCNDSSNTYRTDQSNNHRESTGSNAISVGVVSCGINLTQQQQVCQLRLHNSNSYTNQGSLSTFYESCCATSAKKRIISYNAPFFTTWFCTNWTILYFPVYFTIQSIKSKCITPSNVINESLRGFRDKGLTGGRFLTRCSLFCGLWVSTNYMYIHSLRILLATDVMTLFATNVACVYLLSWVILHEQFVGVRIVAVILCDTGIALLAYMDGITGSPTLGGVVLAASAAAGSAVYKVLFRKVVGDTTFGQISLFFTVIGICNAIFLWPVCLVLYFSGVEYIIWEQFPWIVLMTASILHLAANMLGNFSVAVTYNLFITLGLITAVPVSAALDVILYGANFVGMKLAGMILIATGFFLVMFPNNWPDYFTRLLRWSRRHRHGISGNASRDIIDYRTGYIKSHLRSPSGRVR